MMIENTVNQLMQHVTEKSEIVILNYGMGVESTGLFLRLIFEPEIRPCSLEQLIVIIAQTGDEWIDTAIYVEKYIFPIMRQYKIRCVQVARHGHLEKDGITVLDDSRNPTKCYLKGDYKLSQEMIGSGTVPQFGGSHKCAMKFKGFVIDKWLDENVREPARQMFGYNSDEINRIKSSEDGFKKRFIEKMVFGYNADETSRIKNSDKFNTAYRVGYYPLLEWGWTRQDCLNYIYSKLGVIWKKSACVYCPFGHNQENISELLKRQFEYPDQVAEAMVMEKISLSLNIRAHLYEKGSLIDMIRLSKNAVALEAYQKRIYDLSWSLYYVRRMFISTRRTDRCVERFGDYNFEKAQSLLLSQPGETETKWNIDYKFIKRKTDVPGTEELWVAAPGLVETKARYGVEKFNVKWEAFNELKNESGQLKLPDIA